MFIKNREGKIAIKPGCDGEYGKPVFSNGGSSNSKEAAETVFKVSRKQRSLGEYF